MQHKYANSTITYAKLLLSICISGNHDAIQITLTIPCNQPYRKHHINRQTQCINKLKLCILLSLFDIESPTNNTQSMQHTAPIYEGDKSDRNEIILTIMQHSRED